MKPTFSRFSAFSRCPQPMMLDSIKRTSFIFTHPESR